MTSHSAVRRMRTPTTFLEQPKYIRSSMHAAVVTSGSLTYLVGCGVASDNCSKVWTGQDYHNNFCWSYVGRRKLRLKPYILKSRLSPRIQKTLVIYAIRMRVLHSQSNKLALYLPSGWLLPQKTAYEISPWLEFWLCSSDLHWISWPHTMEMVKNYRENRQIIFF